MMAWIAWTSFPGEVRYFGNPLMDAHGARLKVPHMGWNEVRQMHGSPAVGRVFPT